MLLLVLVALLLASVTGEHFSHNLPKSNKELSTKSEKYARDFADEYIKYMKTGIESLALREKTKRLQQYRSKESWAHGIYNQSKSDKFLYCTTCRATINVAIQMFRAPNGELNGPNKENDAKKAILDICQRFNVQTEEVCAGIFDVHWPLFHFIIQNPNIDSSTFCSMLPIDFCKTKQPELNWTLNINNDNNIDEHEPKAEKPLKGAGDVKILQITDIHYDPEYKDGALALCEEPLCCQRMPSKEKNIVTTDTKLAGYWSDYHVCDTPLHTIENAFDQMRNTHPDIHYIYHTGDVIPHIGWKTTREGNMEMFTQIDKLMTEKFPGIKIFPCVGNHDAHPSDMFSPTDQPEAINIKWAYEHLYSLWSKHLPPETKETILKGGYYTVSPHAGFRIIALNNIDCYLNNWWLYYNASYVIDQLEWLHDTLLAAEKANEYIHILLHVPSGEPDCWTVWSREYNRLIARFHRIISGIFSGHTHKDELNVHYTPKGSAVGVTWNGGSLTTYIGKNPNYRVYEVEQRTMQVVDCETWIFNLTAANLHGASKNPEWFQLYKFSKDFTDDLSPAGVDALLEKMAEDTKLLRKFWRFRMTAADPMLAEGCDSTCLMETICTLSRTSFDQRTRCLALQTKLKQNLPNDDDATTLNELSTAGGDSAAKAILSVSLLLGFCSLIKILT